MSTIIIVDEKLAGGYLVVTYEHAEVKDIEQKQDVIDIDDGKPWSAYAPSGDHLLTIKLTRKT